MNVDEMMRQAPLFGALSAENRALVAKVASTRLYVKGETIFAEGDPPNHLLTVVQGRVKVTKMTPAGKQVILELFGPGDPFGAVAVYKERPYPATAIALTDCVCIVVPSRSLFDLLEKHPSLVRGLLLGLTRRLIELTNRITELSGGKVEPRLARLLLNLAEDKGHPAEGGTFIPIPLSRQELADLTGTTIETCIRIMSRWRKEELVDTRAEGFLIIDMDALNILAMA
jgi:CRP-like cAMP-binding protein